MNEDLEKKHTFSKAIALKSEGGAENTRVVAKGHGKLAEMMLSIAFENGIKVRQDAVLTDILDTLEIDTPIPPEAIYTVTEILRYVYMADGKPFPDGKILPDREEPLQNKKTMSEK